jgi:DegV family protein with EDD domain
MIKIVSDTSTGLTRETAAQYGIELVPQRVMFGTETLRDGVDITNEGFLQRLKTSKVFPTTSQAPVGDYLAAFTPHVDAGDDVLCITLSSALSGTYNSAVTAKQELGSDRVTVIDSKNAAIGQALIVLEATRMANDCRTLPEILARLDRMVAGTKLDLVLDTMEYLVKGGRVGTAQAFIGTLLQMKPILGVRDGRVVPLERVRTKSRAVARLRERVDEAVRGKRQVRLMVGHASLFTEALAMAWEFRTAYTLSECLVIDIPPSIAAHAGPGAIGVAYYAEDA